MLTDLDEKSNKIIRKKLQNLKQIFKKKVDKEFHQNESDLFKKINQIKYSIVYLNDIKTEIENNKYSYHLKTDPKKEIIVGNEEESEKYGSKMIYFVSNMTKKLTNQLSRTITNYQKFKMYIHDYNQKNNTKQSNTKSSQNISGKLN
jgi:hypothetical protein